MDDLPPAWRDHRDEAVRRPPAPGPDEPAFYVEMMDLQGEAYARNAFARGTEREVTALVERLARHGVDLLADVSVLDVGCGDGRHLRALATWDRRRGVLTGIGVDVSPALVAAARTAAERAGGGGLAFEVGDARRLAAVPAVADATAAGGVDVAWTLCQGGFGTSPASDPDVVAGLAGSVRPGGLVVLTAFHALFAARHLAPGDAYDVVHGVHHQLAEVRGPDHARRTFDLWTTAHTAGEAVRLCADAGLDVLELVGCEPGRYDADELRLDDPELLLVCRRR
ncbi:MAG: methyltransferase domain-containing protein [Actinomycetes bacterium]